MVIKNGGIALLKNIIDDMLEWKSVVVLLTSFNKYNILIFMFTLSSMDIMSLWQWYSLSKYFFKLLSLATSDMKRIVLPSMVIANHLGSRAWEASKMGINQSHVLLISAVYAAHSTLSYRPHMGIKKSTLQAEYNTFNKLIAK